MKDKQGITDSVDIGGSGYTINSSTDNYQGLSQHLKIKGQMSRCLKKVRQVGNIYTIMKSDNTILLKLIRSLHTCTYFIKFKWNQTIITNNYFLVINLN